MPIKTAPVLLLKRPSGHASHYKTISDDVPYLLKTPNYILGDGVARYFESLPLNYKWLKNVVNIDTASEKQIVIVCRHLSSSISYSDVANYLHG